MGVIYLDLYDREEFDKGDLYYSVPVVSVEWLETHITLAKGLLSKVKPTDRFNAGEISGRIEALEILLSSARKEAEKK